MTPLRGFFGPLKTPQLRKKVAANRAKLCGTYSSWSNKIFGEKILDQGHPQVELLTKTFGRNSRKWLRQYTGQASGMREAVAGIGRSGFAVVTLPRVAGCEQPNVDYRG